MKIGADYLAPGRLSRPASRITLHVGQKLVQNRLHAWVP
jgi:hypothetical protein